MTALIVVTACALAIAAVDARADSIDNISFTRITSWSTEDVASQLSLDILDATAANAKYGLTGADALASNEVLFVYSNTAVIASNIYEIYIDDGTVVSQSRVYNSLSGYTSFYGGNASPSNLPSWDSIDPFFVATAGFSADITSGPDPTKGIESATDELGISFVVSDGLSGVEDALNDGSLRIGLHVRAIGSSRTTDSFVSEGAGTTPVIPEPGSLALLGLGGLGLLWLRRRRKAS